MAFEHARVAVQGNGLEGVGEIAVVAVGARGHSGGDAGVELRRVQAPLLAGVAAKELVVELAADLADDHVLGSLHRVHFFGYRREELFHLDRVEVQPVELVHGIQVDGDGHLLPIDAGQTPDARKAATA
jgi:hypothetical protein